MIFRLQSHHDRLPTREGKPKDLLQCEREFYGLARIERSALGDDKGGAAALYFCARVWP